MTATAQLPEQINIKFEQSLDRLQTRLTSIETQVEEHQKRLRKNTERPNIKDSALYKAVRTELQRYGDIAECSLDRFVRVNTFAKGNLLFPAEAKSRARLQQIAEMLTTQVRRTQNEARIKAVETFMQEAKQMIRIFFGPKYWLQFLPDADITLEEIYLAQEFPVAMANYLITTWSLALSEKIHACGEFAELPTTQNLDLSCEFEGEKLRGTLIHTLICQLIAERSLSM